jgi:hypothetical protein
MTTFGRSDCLDYIYLYIKVLTPANYDQYFPAKGGQGHWLFQLVIEKKLIEVGEFVKSEKYKELHQNITDAILTVSWADPHKFIINPVPKGNGVLPIKNNFIAHLFHHGWEPEVSMSVIKGLNPGPIDAIYRTEKGIVAVEWETGNISSSHRALNKIALGIIQKQLIGGFLIIPMRTLSKYLTDRIGNYEELAP